MKLKICFLGTLCLFFLLSARAQPKKKFLRVGDQMPDVEITNIMNWKNKSAKISDFKGQVVILDFWNSYCAGCIAAFPKLDSLQRDFKGKLQVMLINPANGNESVRSMKIVIDRMNAWSERRFILPIAYRDSTISGLFDFYGVPYVVLIGPDGKIAAIPDKHEITAANINKILAGEKIELKARADRRPAGSGKASL